MKYRIQSRFNTKRWFERKRDDSILDSKILCEIIRFIFRLIFRGVCKEQAILTAAHKFGVSEQIIKKYL